MRPWKSPLFPWNWRKVRTAQITQADRDLFERYGENVIGTLLTGNVSPQAPDLRSIFTTHEVVEGQGQVIGNKFTAARDWLTECRDAHERHEQRAETIEVGVVVLIGLEIVLSLYGIWEGNKQAVMLDEMKKSTAATAGAMINAETDLQILATGQKNSVGQLQQMNDSLQISTGTARNQLRILKEEQADALAQRSKKPKLTLVLGDLEIDPREWRTIEPPYQTDTSANFDVRLANRGNATAHSLVLRIVIWDQGVGLLAQGSTLLPPTGLFLVPRVYVIPLDHLLPGGTMILSLQFTFPKLHRNPFRISLSADSEETQSGTPLAQLSIRLIGPTIDPIGPPNP